MSTPTHLLVGASIAKAAALMGAPAAPEHILAIAMIAAVAPDIDILVYGYGTKHHASILHKPVIWASLFSVAYAANAVFALPYANALSIAAIGVLSHFILDTGNYSQGVQWLWPFSDNVLHFFKLAKRPDSLKQRWQVFSRHPAFAAEALIWIGAIVFLF